MLEAYVKPFLQSRLDSFVGGQINHCLVKWQSITSDSTILQIVEGEKINFINEPPSQYVIPTNSIAKEQKSQTEEEIRNLIKKQVLVECDHVQGEFLSPIFSVPKKNGKIRLILNLKQLNQHIPYIHFKVKNIGTVLDMLTENCFMATLDLKDAYYCVKIDPDSQKYLRFVYNNKLYQYTVYPSGLSLCPRHFTKLMKPMLCVLREKGHLIIIFIDDLLIIATSYEKCCISILETIHLLTELGFTLNVDKSVLIPAQQAIFLGFVLNSVRMTITLTQEKIHKTVNSISNLLSKKSPSIREVAQVIGYMVSSFPAVKYGKCHYRALENDKIEALKASNIYISISRFKVVVSQPTHIIWVCTAPSNKLYT